VRKFIPKWKIGRKWLMHDKNTGMWWEPLWEIHIKTILSGTSSSIRTKLWWNSHWMVLFQNCVQQSCSPTKIAATVQLCCNVNKFYFIIKCEKYGCLPCYFFTQQCRSLTILKRWPAQSQLKTNENTFLINEDVYTVIHWFRCCKTFSFNEDLGGSMS
jgi:hypothetical protein